ncbi:sulfatase-like hydrolase/transferase [Candidatus Falkowbacteria bacterium]|nr:sulfatase-like hydrolase/transferase [Candidatus Falkowbacteria bacterium]MBT4433276.1 sulfatase-like hydrolase/transferase [Candidatus Falkowbacteria bacterium]
MFTIYLILLLSVFLYFFYYFKLLGLNFTTLSSVFLFLSVSLFLVVLTVTPKNKYLLSFFIFLNSIFYFYALINFAYYQVFDTFLPLTFSQAKGVNFALISFLTDFLYLVPLWLYTASLSIVVITSYLFVKIHKDIIFLASQPELSFQANLVSLSKRKVKEFRGLTRLRSLRVRMWFILIIFSLLIFGTTFYTKNNPKDSWWSHKAYLSDLGVSGFLWGGLYDAFIVSKTNAMIDKSQEYKALVFGEKINYLLGKIGKNENILPKTTPRKLDKPNIIFYQLESVPEWVFRLDPNPLPYFTELKNNNISVKEFYGNSCETINAEFSALCSALPDSEAPVNYSYKNNDYYCLPQLLREKLGYNTALFHAGIPEFYDRNILAKKWGFQELYFNDYFGQKEPDAFVLKKMINKLVQENKQPFVSYVVGFTAHSPHNQEMLDYYKDAFGVEINKYRGKIPDDILNTIEVEEDTLRIYIGFIEYIDESLKVLFDELKNNNLDQNTIVVVYTDHRYYNFYSDNVMNNFLNYNQLPFFIYTPDGYKDEINSIASHVDISPTILDLIGLEKPRHFVGESLFSDNHPDNVLGKCLSRIDYIDKDVVIQGSVKTDVYNVSSRNINLDSKTKQEYIANLKNAIQESDFCIKEDLLTEGAIK